MNSQETTILMNSQETTKSKKNYSIQTLPISFTQEKKCFSKIIILSMFQTEIIQLSTLKNNLNTLLQNISAKYTPSKDYEVTIILKQAEPPSGSATSIHPKSDTKRHNCVGFIDNPMILNQDFSEPQIDFSDKIESRQSVKSDKGATPLPSPPQMANKIKFKRKDDKENESPQGRAKASICTQTQNGAELTVHTDYKVPDSPADSQRFSYKLNNLQVQSSNSDQDSQQADGSDGGFLIENCLSQALQYIQGSNTDQLQDFLYRFKEKHNFINVRADAKWSLLMGYCKESKMQFERAATNYSQVVIGLTHNPMMLSVQIADIYCRLGRCYCEIGQWNKAITAYSHALNKYKHNRKCLDYANCITNLGTLYLQIGYFIEAERCFLMALNIKRAQGDKRSKIGLIQTYFHLFDCNLKLRNLLQCEQILANVSNIIQDSQGTVEPILKVRFYIKCGKILFFDGRLELAENHYHLALNTIKRQNLSVQQHAEVLELIAILKQETGQLQSSKLYLQKAYQNLQRFVPIQSPKLGVLKKKMECLNEALTDRCDGGMATVKTTKKMEKSNNYDESDEEENNVRSAEMVLCWKKGNR